MTNFSDTMRKFLDLVENHSKPFSWETTAYPLTAMLLEAKLGGVSVRSFKPDELSDYMDRIAGKEKKKTDKYKYPYIHSGNIPSKTIPIKSADQNVAIPDADVEELPELKAIVDSDSGKKYDLVAFYNLITQRPEKILKQNEKMEHSDGSSQIYFNIGLPAIKGLAADEEIGPPNPDSEDGGASSFVIIDTCPGAGPCMIVCYATKGGYVQWKASSLAGTRLLNYLWNDPQGFMSQLASEIESAKKRFSKKGIDVVIRWHDAGDFFSPDYLQMAYDVARKFPEVLFYAYTKIADVATGEKPDNFVINFSSGAQPREERKVDLKKTKHSFIVPKQHFKDALEKDETGKWQYKDAAAQNNVKASIAKAYDIDPQSLLTYDEYMGMPRSNEIHKYNVIVKPGDGDVAASRRDVLGSYLLIH